MIPNYLATGLRGARGSTVLLGLFVLLTLVRGGVGHIPFFVALWAYSTRVRRPPPGVGPAVGTRHATHAEADAGAR